MAINKQIGNNNPANEKPVLPKGYRPMSAGQRKLEVPEIEGYRLYWFRDDPGRIEEAKRAGYTFVEKDEISLNDTDLGGGDDKGDDLGDRVSRAQGGGAMQGNQPARLYLMKCPIEIAEYAQELVNRNVDVVVEALKGGTSGQEKLSRSEREKTYSEVDAPLLKRKN